MSLQKFPKDGVKKLVVQMEKQRMVYEEKALIALQKATQEKTEALSKAETLQVKNLFFSLFYHTKKKQMSLRFQFVCLLVDRLSIWWPGSKFPNLSICRWFFFLKTLHFVSTGSANYSKGRGPEVAKPSWGAEAELWKTQGEPAPQ